MSEDRPKKIALIGATGYKYDFPDARVESFRWDRLKKVANLADYDVVILNLLSLEDPSSLDAKTFVDIHKEEAWFSFRYIFVMVLLPALCIKAIGYMAKSL